MGATTDQISIRRLTLTVAEAGQVLGVSRSYAYELVRQGQLPCMRLGRRIVVPVRALEALLDAPTSGFTATRGS
ncbi:MAG: helix-turn-helix domain-containing protein [Acidimicrobiales bacterium]